MSNDNFDFENMKGHCEGYCGGMYPISEMTQVGREGERMCFDCACKARGGGRACGEDRQLYTNSDPT